MSTENPGSGPGTVERTRVWNRDFILLFQGQLVSVVGDTAFMIALGFWVLAETGSSAVMGTVVALSGLARVIAGPAGGVFADRWSRKWTIVGMDLFRGAVVMLGAILLFRGNLSIPVVLAGAVGIGAADAFFQPAVGASVPDLVPRARLVEANSAVGLVQPLAGILGNSLGGVLYTALGAPLLFVFNAVTYLLSAVSESFMRLTHRRRATASPVPADPPPPGGAGVDGALETAAAPSEAATSHRGGSFWAELSEGFTFAWKHRALGPMFLNVGLLNFLLTMGSVVLIPYFSRTPGLNAGAYGLTMTALTGASLIGLGFLQAVRVPAKRRFMVFAIAALVFSVGRIFLIILPVLPVIMLFAVMVGSGVAVINAILISSIHHIVPEELRGKVIGLLGTFAGALSPLGLFIGGVLGDIFPIPLIVPASGLAVLVGFMPLLFNKSVVTAMSFE